MTEITRRKTDDKFVPVDYCYSIFLNYNLVKVQTNSIH